MAVEDDSAMTEAELGEMVVVFPPPTPDQVRALRAKLGLSQSQFALRFGFTIDTVQQYEQGRRRPSGPASTLLRVIEAEPEAVIRALHPRRWASRDTSSSDGAACADETPGCVERVETRGQSSWRNARGGRPRL
jgi:DNA-binding transcriptional regulator YiaG